MYSNRFGKHDVRVNAEREFLAKAVVFDISSNSNLLDYLTSLRDEFNEQNNGSGVVIKETDLVGLVKLFCCLTLTLFVLFRFVF